MAILLNLIFIALFLVIAGVVVVLAMGLFACCKLLVSKFRIDSNTVGILFVGLPVLGVGLMEGGPDYFQSPLLLLGALLLACLVALFGKAPEEISAWVRLFAISALAVLMTLMWSAVGLFFASIGVVAKLWGATG